MIGSFSLPWCVLIPSNVKSMTYPDQACATGVFAVILIWLSVGVGTHFAVAVVAHPNETQVFLKALYGGELAYTLSIALTKLVGDYGSFTISESSKFQLLFCNDLT